MEQRLQEVLLDGEIVRWSGRPSPFKLMSIPSRTSLLLTWVLCSAALAVILGGLIPFFLRTPPRHDLHPPPVGQVELGA